MTLRHIALTAIIIICSLSVCGQTSLTDSLMRELHHTIENRAVFEKRKEDTIKKLRNELAAASDDDARFSLLNTLFDEFRPYNTDSALVYCERREQLALKSGRPDFIANALLNTINSLGQTGMYVEATDILRTLDRRDIPDYMTAYYYYVVNNLYSNMADYTIRPKDRQRYRAISNQYKDSVVANSTPGTLSYVVNLADRLNSNGEYGKAIALLENYLKQGDYTTHDRAICAYTLACAYRNMGDMEKCKQNLIISSIADLQASVREYVSLRQLGVQLYREGDIANAHKFLRIAMDDAQKCNARLRVIEINDIFPIVNESYVKEIKKQRSTMILLAIIIALFLLLSLGATYYIWRQRQKIAAAHSQAKQANSKLQELNDELRDFNQKLSEANHTIAENSQIKEEYIAQFMDQCSLYIEKLDTYRKSLNKLLSAGKIDELKNRLKSTDLQDDDLKAFYRTFDATFLKLFPTFVADFNKLLSPQEQIVLKRDGQLNTELRIYALIRLGINDSVKIAQFLRYSVTTIYNYRTKTRNKALGDRNKLEDDVMAIGRHTM